MRPCLHRRRKRVVDVPGHHHGSRWLFEMGAGRREGDHLLVDTVLPEHAFAVVQVAMAGHQDVVVAGVMDVRSGVSVDRHTDAALTRLQRLHVLRWIVVVVKIDHAHSHVSR